MSIHDLMTEVRKHPDYVAGVIFVAEDFNGPDAQQSAKDNAKWIEERMCEAGFECASECFNIDLANEDE